VLYTM